MTGFGQQILAIIRSKLFVKLLLEFLPLALFLIAVDIYNIYVGSAVLAVRMVLSARVCQSWSEWEKLRRKTLAPAVISD